MAYRLEKFSHLFKDNSFRVLLFLVFTLIVGLIYIHVLTPNKLSLTNANQGIADNQAALTSLQQDQQVYSKRVANHYTASNVKNVRIALPKQFLLDKSLLYFDKLQKNSPAKITLSPAEPSPGSPLGSWPIGVSGKGANDLQLPDYLYNQVHATASRVKATGPLWVVNNFNWTTKGVTFDAQILYQPEQKTSSGGAAAPKTNNTITTPTAATGKP